MNRADIWLIILCMMLVTFIPRALPAIFVGKVKFGPKMEKFLNLIPYTAMTALIFPGVITVDTANPVIGVAGGTLALILAWKKCPVIICVLAAIAVDFILYCVI